MRGAYGSSLLISRRFALTLPKKARQEVLSGKSQFILDAETEHERGPVAMADDYQLKYGVMVAGAIGAVVLLLGLVGLIANIS